jgi:hypothetical protein
MQKKSQSPDQGDFHPKSFVIFCVDHDDNIALDLSWGENLIDIKNFAQLLSKITSGDFNSLILQQLKEQSKSINDGNRKYSAFDKEFKSNKSSVDLVVDPTQVELN